MSYCWNCGKQIADRAKFCPYCASPQTSQESQASQQAAQTARTSQTTSQASAAYTQQADYRQQTSYQQTAAPARAQSFSSRGPLGRAWDDWKASPGKWGITLKISLLKLVPGIGGLVGTGYATSWGRECALGRKESMSTKIIRPGMLDTGLYAYAIDLIVSVVLTLVGALAYALFDAIDITFIGTLLMIAISLLGGPIRSVMSMMGAICGRIRDGLNVGRAWNAISTEGKTGSLLAAVWVPSILSGLLTVVVVVVWVAIFAAGALTGVSRVSSLRSITSLLTSISGSLITLLITVLALAFLVSFISIAADLVSRRAVGYWFEDFKPATWPEYQQNAGAYARQSI